MLQAAQYWSKIFDGVGCYRNDRDYILVWCNVLPLVAIKNLHLVPPPKQPLRHNPHLSFTLQFRKRKLAGCGSKMNIRPMALNSVACCILLSIALM
jgi:hypothetical protein